MILFDELAGLIQLIFQHLYLSVLEVEVGIGLEQVLVRLTELFSHFVYFSCQLLVLLLIHLGLSTSYLEISFCFLNLIFSSFIVFLLLKSELLELSYLLKQVLDFFVPFSSSAFLKLQLLPQVLYFSLQLDCLLFVFCRWTKFLSLIPLTLLSLNVSFNFNIIQAFLCVYKPAIDLALLCLQPPQLLFKLFQLIGSHLKCLIIKLFIL